MNELSKQRHELTLRPMDPSAGTWDGAAVSYLEGGDFLAFVADAPVKARPESATLISEFIKACLPKFKERLTASHRELTALLLADLATAVGQHLLLTGSGAAYAACVFVLVRGDAIFVLSVGDCAAYLVGESLLRLSEATRVGGASVLSIFGAGGTKPEEFITGSYLGAAPRAFSQRDVTVLPNQRIRAIVLVSDGAEQQVGLDRLNHLLRSCVDPSELKTKFNELLTGPLIDDVTLLAVTVEPFVGGLESSLEQIQQRLNAMDHDLPNTLAPLSRRAEELQFQIQTLDQGCRSSVSQTYHQLRDFEGLLKTQDARVTQIEEQLSQARQQVRLLNASRSSSGQAASVSSTVPGDVASRLNSDLLAVQRDSQELRREINRLRNQLELGPPVSRNTRSYRAVLRAWLTQHASAILFSMLVFLLALAVFAVIRLFLTTDRVEPSAPHPSEVTPASPQPRASATSNDYHPDDGRDPTARETPRRDN